MLKFWMELCARAKFVRQRGGRKQSVKANGDIEASLTEEQSCGRVSKGANRSPLLQGHAPPLAPETQRAHRNPASVAAVTCFPFAQTQFPHFGDEALKIAEREGTQDGIRRKRETASRARAR